MNQPLRVGARVRIRASLVPERPDLHHPGTIMRVDARGLLIRLDTGREVLAEPRVVEALEEP